MAPLIGLTSNYFDERYHEKAPDLMPLRDQGAYLIPEDFPRCIERAGGVPVMIPVTDDLSLAARYAEICDGFFFIGGACDVDPRRYRQERSEFVTNLVARKDDFEFALAKYVVEQTDKPLLGVCRGSQVINAAFGGTLIQHLSARGYRGHRFAGGAKGAPQHSVRIEKDSFLYRATGAVVAAVPVVKGLGAMCGLDMVDVEGANGEIDTNIEGKSEAAWEMINTHDFVLVHLEAPDECSHAGDLKNKLQSIEWLDSRLITPLLKKMDDAGMEYRLIISDHRTFVRTKDYEGSPVPFILYDSRVDTKRGLNYTEENGMNGPNVLHGDKLLDILFENIPLEAAD